MLNLGALIYFRGLKMLPDHEVTGDFGFSLINIGIGRASFTWNIQTRHGSRVTIGIEFYGTANHLNLKATNTTFESPRFKDIKTKQNAAENGWSLNRTRPTPTSSKCS
jgi:hypothetical protein